jgi:hypothetical protein
MPRLWAQPFLPGLRIFSTGFPSAFSSLYAFLLGINSAYKPGSPGFFIFLPPHSRFKSSSPEIRQFYFYTSDKNLQKKKSNFILFIAWHTKIVFSLVYPMLLSILLLNDINCPSSKSFPKVGTNIILFIPRLNNIANL